MSNRRYHMQIVRALAKVANACPEAYRIEPSKIMLVVNDRGRRSNGGMHKGKPWLSIKAASYDKHEGGAYYFNEYASIKGKASIGAFYSTSFENSLLALVAHEYAHMIQFCHRKPAAEHHGISPQSFSQPHGHGWQVVYSQLRQALGLTANHAGIFATKKEAQAYANASQQQQEPQKVAASMAASPAQEWNPKPLPRDFFRLETPAQQLRLI